MTKESIVFDENRCACSVMTTKLTILIQQIDQKASLIEINDIRFEINDQKCMKVSQKFQSKVFIHVIKLHHDFLWKKGMTTGRFCALNYVAIILLYLKKRVMR